MSTKTNTAISILDTFLNASSDYSERAVDIKPCDPREPDFLCLFSNGYKTYFELSEIIDRTIAQNCYDTKRAFVGGFFDDEILTKQIRNKLSKLYETKGLSVDLLLYFDLQPPWPETVMVDQIRAVIEKRGKGLFENIWLFSVPNKKVIGLF